MPGEIGSLSDQFWINLCTNFGLLLLVIVCVTAMLLMLYCGSSALSVVLARSESQRRGRELMRPRGKAPEHRFTIRL